MAQLLHHLGAVTSLRLEATGGAHHAAYFGGPQAAPAAPLRTALASVTSLAHPFRHGLVEGGAHCSGQAQPCNPAQIWMLASSSWLLSQTILLESNKLHKCQETSLPLDAASMK